MARIPKRLFALGGIAAGGAFLRRRRAARPTPPAPSPSAPAPAPAAPRAAAQPAAEAPPIAPPPVEAPGPSVTAPAHPESETERAERAEATTPDPELLADRAGGPVDELVEAETAAAAAEAAAIGGPKIDDAQGDPAMEPVYEAGGGEAEGFEAAEADLIENASHGDGGGDPLRDRLTPEVEADIATGVSGEADEEKVSEVVDDLPSAETTGAEAAGKADDPGSGPGITHER